MRIISGYLKGKKLLFSNLKNTRPLRDVVKENIFNILKHSNMFDKDMKDSNILDLYSGTGSFGLECISRGAKYTVFVEKDSEAIDVLIENINTLKIDNEKFLVNNRDVKSFINSENNDNFDIIFFDPPYAESLYLADLKLLNDQKKLLNNTLVIIHRDADSNEDLRSLIDVLMIKKYGRSKIIFGSILR